MSEYHAEVEVTAAAVRQNAMPKLPTVPGSLRAQLDDLATVTMRLTELAEKLGKALDPISRQPISPAAPVPAAPAPGGPAPFNAKPKPGSAMASQVLTQVEQLQALENAIRQRIDRLDL